jgi:hypothetical protein
MGPRLSSPATPGPWTAAEASLPACAPLAGVLPLRCAREWVSRLPCSFRTASRTLRRSSRVGGGGGRGEEGGGAQSRVDVCKMRVMGKLERGGVHPKTHTPTLPPTLPLPTNPYL